MTKNSKLKRFISVVLCVLLFTGVMSSCSKAEETGIRALRSVLARNTMTTDSTNAAVHYIENTDSFGLPIVASGLIELLVDKKTCSFAIREKAAKEQLWTALPLLEDVDEEKIPSYESSMVSLKVTGKSDIYNLNSQDNSVAYGTASVTENEEKNGATFTFKIFADEETAAKKTYDKTDIGFEVIMKIILQDGSMNVLCSHSNITGNPDAFIESMDVLNCFGAYNDTKTGDFLLVPDGCGAVINTAIYDESFESLSFSVYGNDPSAPLESSGNAVIPAFGIKHGNFALAAIIEKGDAVASINAKKATGANEYNSVYPSFSITPVGYKDETLYVSKSSTVPEIALCYRFLAGNNATYAGIASACREQLIRNSVLSTRTVDSSDYLPFYLTLTGATTKTFGPLKYLSTLTTFEQAGDMLVRMKGKGINNVSIRYTGVFDGGINSKDIVSASILRRLGGSDKLNELYEYVSSQKMSLFLDINLLSSSVGFSGTNATDIYKEKSSFTPNRKLVDYMSETMNARQLRSIEKIKNVVAQVLTDNRYFGFSGYCLNDAGSVLYSDFSNNGLLRESASEKLGAAIVPLSTGNPTMADTGNFYMLKNINSVINIPLKTTVSQSGAYIGIPFVQLVLHGIVDYAGTPINSDINLEETLLKYVEYGACPHFEWNYEPLMGKAETDTFYYDNTINAAAEFYTEANEALNDLRDARITDHYELEESDGVYCTEYDTGARIYVNYTNNEFSGLGVVVEPRSFLRVN